MNLIKIQIVGATEIIDKFIRKLTKRFSDALVFEVTRIPCVGEIIELGNDLETETFRLTRVVHYTIPDFYNAWGCITVEPCNLLSVLEAGVRYVLDDSDNDHDLDEDDDDIPELIDDDDNDIPELIDDDDIPELIDDDDIPELIDDDNDDIPEIPDDDDDDDDIPELPNLYDINFSSKRRYLGRLPNGVCTPEEAYKLPILQALDLLGGSAKTKDVLAVVKKLMKGVLKKVDYEKAGSSSRSETRWHKRAKWVRYDLIAEGLVKKDSLRGVWEISKMGRQYLTRNLNR
jgi:Mrr N-terminal domain